jgi:hypothetical protein
VFDLIGDARHNHRIEVVGGVLGDDAGKRLSNYFRSKRGRPPLLAKQRKAPVDGCAIMRTSQMRHEMP